MSWLRDIDQWFIDEVLPHSAVFRSRAIRLCGPNDADDLVQEAYARVLGVRDHRAVGSARSFVLAILQNLAFERLRRSKVVRIEAYASLELLGTADPAPDSFSIISARSELKQLLALIDRLPPQCSRVVRMRKVQSLPPSEIAEQLGLSVSTVEKHLAKGLALITKARHERYVSEEAICPEPLAASLPI